MEIEGNEMGCQKCNGKMVHERFFDLQDETGKLSFRGCRCLLCGDIVDPVILGNRKNKTRYNPRTRRKRKFSVV